MGCVFGLLWLTYSFTRPAPIQLPLDEDLEAAPKVSFSDAKVEGANFNEKALVLDMGAVAQPTSAPAVVDDEKRALQEADAAAEDSSSDSNSESGDEFNEKFEDAEDLPDSSSAPESPSPVYEDAQQQLSEQQNHADPELLPLPNGRPSTPFMTPPPSPQRRLSPLAMREANISLARPAWSVRAADAPPLGLTHATPSLRPSRPSTPSTPPTSSSVPASKPPVMRAVPSTPVSFPPSLPNSRPGTPAGFFREPHVPGAFSDTDEYDRSLAHAARRGRSSAYRAPVPELDIAFAMQLRPGLGLGSDPAWLVRFLMAMFGWMTVFIGNGQQETVRRRAIA